MSRFPTARVIGHRGAAASAPENTLAGFRHARDLGVGWIEWDVQLTADGQPVIFHDDRLERTTDGTGVLTATSSAALAELDAGAWFAPAFRGERVPTLKDALALVLKLDLGLCMEIKASDARGAVTAERALAETMAMWPADRRPPLLSSFVPTALEASMAIAPDWPRALLVEDLAGDWVGETRRLGCCGLHCDQRTLDGAAVARIKAEGLDLFAYTVNERSRADELWGWGVDAIFSDRPEIMK